MCPNEVFDVIGQNEQKAEFLIKNGANIDARGHDNIRPLHCALDNGLSEIAILLLTRGADVNLPTNERGSNLTPRWYFLERNERRSNLTPMCYFLRSSIYHSNIRYGMRYLQAFLLF